MLKIARGCITLLFLAPLVVAPLFAFPSGAFPLNGFFPFISLKAIYFRVLVEVALFFYILHLIAHPRRKEEVAKIVKKLRHPIFLSLFVFILLILISAATAENRVQAFWSNFERGEGSFQVLHYALYFVLLTLLFQDWKKMLFLIKTNVVVSFFVGLYALFQLPAFAAAKAALGIIGPTGRVSGTLGNPSYLAAYLLIVAVCMVYWWKHSDSARTKTLLSILGVFHLFLFLNTGTRAAFLALAVAIVILMCSAMVRSTNKKIKIAIGSTLLGGGVLLAFLISLYYTTSIFKPYPVFDRMLDVRGIAQGFAPRGWTWASALEGIKERPLLGWGMENFPYPFDQHYDPRHYGQESFFDRTHNTFLEYAISGGLLLATAYIALLWFAFKELFKRPQGMWRSLLFAALVAYLIQGFFLFDVLVSFLVFFFLLAIILNRPEEHPAHPDQPSVYSWNTRTGIVSVVALTLLIMLFVSTAYRPWHKNQLLTRALGISIVDASGRLDLTRLQLTLNAFQETVNYPSPVGQEETVSNSMKYFSDFIEFAANQKIALPGNFIRSLVDTNNKWYDENEHLFPGVKDAYINGGLNLRAGYLFGQTDYTARGKAVYAKALEYSPTRIEFIIVLLSAARAENDKAAYDELLARAKTLRPDIAWQPFEPIKK